MILSEYYNNDITILRGENEQIRFDIAPALGGKIMSVYNKVLQKEFLWHNSHLLPGKNAPGADYDTNFWGGIDELIPNDIPETVDGIAYPDHGELWTTALQSEVAGDKLTVSGKLPLSELYYQKTIWLDKDLPVIHLQYKIRNEAGTVRHFLWKLHAALAVAAGDKLATSARKARSVYPDNSRFKTPDVFQWPMIENVDAAVVPPFNHSMDFFYLYDIPAPEMGMLSKEGQHLFKYSYDVEVFPFQWYFASYGKFNEHYTVILEPASAMPVSVNEASDLDQCSVLAPGEEINSVVKIYAGPNS